MGGAAGPAGAPQQARQAADARFGPGAGDAFKRALDTLRGGTDPRLAGAGQTLLTALRSGDATALRDAAVALEGLVKDRIANPQQAGGLFGAIAVLKQHLASARSRGGDDFAAGHVGAAWAQFSG